MIAANGADANPTGSLSVLPNSIAAGVVSSCDVTNPSVSRTNRTGLGPGRLRGVRLPSGGPSLTER